MFVLKKFIRKAGCPVIMGIVNASGDSFSEGAGSAPESAVHRGCALAAGGAGILDIGGESTRPGAQEVSCDLEISRVIPVLDELKRRLPEMIFSIDTRHPEVAEEALKHGAHIINDVSMLRTPGNMEKVAARYGAGLILNHSRGCPGNMLETEFVSYPDGMAETVAAELGAAAGKAVAAGVDPENLMFDPGIGFAKESAQCWEVLRELDKIAPPADLVVGVSRKSFIGALTGEKIPEKRRGGTLALELELAARKIGVIRTHEVKMLCDAIKTMFYYRSLCEI